MHECVTQVKTNNNGLKRAQMQVLALVGLAILRDIARLQVQQHLFDVTKTHESPTPHFERSSLPDSRFWSAADDGRWR